MEQLCLLMEAELHGNQKLVIKLDNFCRVKKACSLIYLLNIIEKMKNCFFTGYLSNYYPNYYQTDYPNIFVDLQLREKFI